MFKTEEEKYQSRNCPVLEVNMQERRVSCIQSCRVVGEENSWEEEKSFTLKEWPSQITEVGTTFLAHLKK